MTKHAPDYLISWWRQKTEEIFQPEDVDDVLAWLIANRDRARVVLVGSGFSRNAINPRQVPIPLWKDISDALARSLRIGHDDFDPLTLVDLFRADFNNAELEKLLLTMLDDNALTPSLAHDALWKSKPEAVITTNFLDTLLERNQSAFSARRDAELARPVPKGKIPLIYLHGHRSDADNWVVGRQDYEDIEETRPMIFARTRQLFAQYPLLIVGYSLTDPDFHLVYRHVVRSMEGKHPLGLAVMLPASKSTQQRRHRLHKSYWKKLGLRVVCFREASDSNALLEQLFTLTQQFSTVDDLLECLDLTDRGGTVELFARNIKIVKSALEDPELTNFWIADDGPYSKGIFWDQAFKRIIEDSRLNTIREKADEKCRTRIDELSSRNVKYAPDSVDEGLKLKPGNWKSAVMNSREFQQVSGRLESWIKHLYQSHAFAWQLNEVFLQCGTEAQNVIGEWLRVAVCHKEVLDSGHVDAGLLMTALLLVGGGYPKDLELVSKRAEFRAPELYEIIEPLVKKYSPESKQEPKVVRLLNIAREYLDSGDLDGAETSYEQAAEEADISTSTEAPIWLYFSLIGLTDVSRAKGDFRKGFAGEVRYRAQAKHPIVARWLEQVETGRQHSQNQIIKSVTQKYSSHRTEPATVRFSNVRSSLQMHQEEAKREGAPHSIQKWIINPLCEPLTEMLDQTEFRSQIQLRIQFDLKQPGRWLKEQLRMAIKTPRNNDDGAYPLASTLISNEISNVIFEANSKTTIWNANAILNLVAKYSIGLTADDIQCAKKILKSNYITKINQSLRQAYEAWAGIAVVSSWNNELRDELKAAMGYSEVGFNQLVGALPIYRWALEPRWIASASVQNFFEDILVDMRLWPSTRASLLIRLYDSANGADWVIRYCSQYLREIEDESELTSFYTSLLIISPAILKRAPDIEESLRTQLNAGLLPPMRLLAHLSGVDVDHKIYGEIRKTLQSVYPQGFVKKGDLEDIFGQAMLIYHPEPTLNKADRSWKEIAPYLDESWRNMVGLASTLSLKYWSDDDWQKIQEMLRSGGHTKYPATWGEYRNRLIKNALKFEDSRQAIFDDSERGLGFLRRALWDCVGYGEFSTVREALKVFPKIAPYIEREDDAFGFKFALETIARDSRIELVAEAAYVSNYLYAYYRRLEEKGIENQPKAIVEIIDVSAASVKRILADSPLVWVEINALLGMKHGRRQV